MFDIHSLTKNYHDFWIAGDSLVDQWRDKVESAAPHIYSRIVTEYGYKENPMRPDVSMHDLPAVLEKVNTVVENQVSRLMQLTGVSKKIRDLYLVPLNKTSPCLTGCWTDIQRDPICIIGFDGFLKHLDYFAVICSHEMTHALHMHYNHPGPIESQTGTFAQCLWNEGLAEYTSLKLNPAFPIAKALRGSLLKYSFEDLKPLFRAYLKIFDTSLEEKTFPLHRTWFGMGGAENGINIPPAAAYIMGYRTIEKLTARFSLLDLIKMDQDSYGKLLKEVYN